jgi:hypothetical protein
VTALVGSLGPDHMLVQGASRYYAQAASAYAQAASSK